MFEPVQFNLLISYLVTKALNWRLLGQPMQRNQSYLAYTSLLVQ